MFRTQGGDFGFPYHNPQSEVEKNRELSRQLFQHDKWPKATRKFQWLLDKFNPPDWGLTRGIIYYTDNELAKNIAKPCREAIIKASKDKNIPITTAALHRKLDFGVKNIYFPSLKRSYLSMFKQILGALENSSADIIFFCEADVLYHPTHFDFIPPEKDTFYFKSNSYAFQKLVLHHGLSITKIMDEFNKRTNLLIAMYKKGIFDFKEVKEVINEYYKDPKIVLKNFGII